MAKAPMKIKLPKRLIKELGLKPGDWLQLILGKKGEGVIIASAKQTFFPLYGDEEWEGLWEALEAVTGIWANRTDITDSRTYVRQLRQEWQRAWKSRKQRIFGERRQGE